MVLNYNNNNSSSRSGSGMLGMGGRRMRVMVGIIALVGMLMEVVVGTQSYVLVTEPMSWYEADIYCMQNHGTHLATVLSAADTAAINGSLSVGSSVWIGLNDIGTKGSFFFNNGYSFALFYSSWGSGQPAKANGNCVRFEGGVWYIESCLTTLPFVCGMGAMDYIFYPATVTSQSSAETYCMQYFGTHLPSFSSDADIAEFTSYAPYYAPVYIGLSDQASPGTFVYTSGAAFTVNNWESGQPTLANSCVSVDSSGQWYVDSCSDAGGRELACNGQISSFYFVNESMTWSDANTYCSSTFGTSLGTIANLPSYTQINWIQGLPFWFGLNDLETTGDFKFVSGVKLGAYTNWVSPSNGTGDCVYINDAFFWQVASCSTLLPFVCDSAPPTPAPTASPIPAPTTKIPTTPKPTTQIPTTHAPVTHAPTTVKPTNPPTTKKPTIKKPTRSPYNYNTTAPSVHPTTMPTTYKPTVTPTPLPTLSPTKQPTTLKPTKFPTTTNAPIHGPTTSPTKPPASFFSGYEQIGSLDLFVILDNSAGIVQLNSLCAKVTKGAISTCWALFLDFAEKFISAVATAFQFGSGATGLRVAIYAFSCSTNELTPVSTAIVANLTSSAETIFSALSDAAQLTPSGGSCPSLVLEQIIEIVENNWSGSILRPYKMALLITNGYLYDFSKGSKNYINDAKALRERCVETIAVPIQLDPTGLSTQDAALQKKDLSELAGSTTNIYPFLTSSSSFGESAVISGIQLGAGAALNTNSGKQNCKNLTLYDYPPKIYCGYDETMCAARFGCVWTGKKCQIVINCDYPTEAFCLQDPTCVYTGSICQTKSVCSGLTTKATCTANPLCKFKKKVCILKTTG